MTDTEGDHGIVEGRHHGAQPEPELEPERNVDDHRDHAEHHGPRGPVHQFLPDLRPDVVLLHQLEASLGNLGGKQTLHPLAFIQRGHLDQ